MSQPEVQYVDEPYYPQVRLGTQYASFLRATSTGTDIYVYYQDHFTKLHECHWSTAEKRWRDTQIDTGSPWPMPGTSLAVVTWDKSIRLYYMNVDWTICEAVFDEGVHDKWKVGSLNKSKISAHPESSLSAVVLNTGKGDQTSQEIQVFFQNGYLNIQSTIYHDAIWSASTPTVSTDAKDPHRAMLGSSLAFANIGSGPDAKIVGFYQTDGGMIQEISWTPDNKWGQGLTNILLNFDDTKFRTPLAVSALHHDNKNTLQLVYMKGTSIYHRIWTEGEGWNNQAFLVGDSDKLIEKPGLCIASRTFSGGGIKMHLYTSVVPNGIGSYSFSGDHWEAPNGPMASGTKHTIKAQKKEPKPPPGPPFGQTVDGISFDKMRPGSKYASVMIDTKFPDVTYAVFYQANDNSIVMASYDPKLSKWTETEAIPGENVRSGTAIAASQRPGYDDLPEIDLFFVTKECTLGYWYTMSFGKDNFKKGFIQISGQKGDICVHPLTDICSIMGGPLGYNFVFYQDPEANIREVAQMGDWFGEELRMPALPGTSLAFVDKGTGSKAYEYLKSGVFQLPNGDFKQITKSKSSEYDYHEWEDGPLDIKLSVTSPRAPISCAVTRDNNGNATMHLFYSDTDGKLVEKVHNEKDGWQDGQNVCSWKLPAGGAISASPHYWYQRDGSKARLYTSAPINAVAELIQASDGYEPQEYGKGFVPIGGDQVKAKITI